MRYVSVKSQLIRFRPPHPEVHRLLQDALRRSLVLVIVRGAGVCGRNSSWVFEARTRTPAKKQPLPAIGGPVGVNVVSAAVIGASWKKDRRPIYICAVGLCEQDT